MTYGWIALAGAAGSLHCIGMCGGFAVAIGTNRSQPVLRQILYNVGRVNTLAAIGAACGGAGAAILTAAPVAAVEHMLAILAGILMVVVGLETLGFGSRLQRVAGRFVHTTIGQRLSGVMRAQSLAAPLAFGVFNAFLPCGLIYAFAARAAATASPIEGAATMLAFGLGTVPAMFLTGLAGNFVSLRLRSHLAATAAAAMVLFGAVTVARGFGVTPAALGGSHAACHHAVAQ